MNKQVWVKNEVDDPPKIAGRYTLFVQNEKVYCRLFLFEEISNTVRICAMHTSDIRDVSVLEEIKIPEMESNYKIIGKVLAFLRKNNLF